ncbi:MAG: replication-associated recombination protein A [Firmicutes bacterium]|nr:replication-associated recombination protein A [Bacillota bacterium]
MDLFDQNLKIQEKKNAPLAERIRPSKLEDIVGQKHLLAKGKPLYEAIIKDIIPSMILYGPPGSGKTTIARVIANSSRSNFVSMNAVIDGIPKIKEVIEEAKNNLKLYSTRTILFIDEIHRFNKNQQDALLPFLESGLIILIGATTENPFVEINKALISRLLLFKLNQINNEDIEGIVERALKDKNNGYGNFPIIFDDKIKLIKFLIHISNGDLRKTLNALEQLVSITQISEDGSIHLTYENAQILIKEKSLPYDKGGSEHYNVISAFIKSVRGSDANATLHYLARMIEGGEDPMFIARRLIILASEDIGLADSNALVVATSGAQALMLIGMPEGRIILGHVATYLAKAPKSNSAYLGIDAAIDDVKNFDIGFVPEHLCNYHDGYVYPHNFEDKNYIVEQQYLPNSLKDKIYYIKKKFDK